MAAGDPILVDLSGAAFGLGSAETGVIIESMDRELSSKMKDVFDGHQNRTIGTVFYDFMAAWNWSAILNSFTTPAGFALAAPGVALTVANSSDATFSGNGVASGGIYTKTVKISQAPEDLRKFDGTAVQRAAMT